MNKKTTVNLSLLSAVVLSILSMAKIVLLASNPKEMGLTFANPLIPFISNWVVLSASAALEMLIAYKLVISRNAPIKGGICLGWLTILILIYRIGMWLVSPESTCHCIGVFGLLIGSGKILENEISAAILILLMVNIGLLLYLGRRQYRSITSQLTIQTIAVGFCFFFMFNAIASDAVEISGDVRYELYDNKGAISVANDYSFIVIRGEKLGNTLSESLILTLSYR